MQATTNLNHLHDIHYLRRFAGLTADQAARLFGVSLRTWRRYETEGAPASIRRCLRWESGHVPGWEGFRILPGLIYTPAGEAVYREHVDNFRYMLRLLMDGQDPDLRQHLQHLLAAA